MFTVNGQVVVQGKTFWRVDDLSRGLEGVEFLMHPALFVADQALAIRIVKLLNADAVRSDAAAKT